MLNNTESFWWKRDDLFYNKGVLQFANRSLTELASTHDTPTFFYSTRRILDNIQRLYDALNGTSIEGHFSIYYAMKANRFSPLLSFLNQTKLVGIDACSPAEVAHAIESGFNTEQISFTATSLSKRDWHELCQYDQLLINCDCLSAIKQLGELKPGTDIGIRINPSKGTGRAGNDKLQYAGPQTSKFGIYREQFKEALTLAEKYHLTVRQIHFHTGCGFLNQQILEWEAVLESAQWFIEQIPSLTHVNLGGGLGVPHTQHDDALDLNLWASLINKHFGNTTLQVCIEPGEYLVKDSGLLLVSKTYCEIKRETLFVGVDAGFNIAPEPAYYDMPFEVVPIIIKENDMWQHCQVVGNINEALDVWQRDIKLPNPQDAEYYAILNAGAYSSSMASNHCMRNEFHEVLLLPTTNTAIN